MILNNTPVHEAVLSNVGEIGEFRIRNSAKAFSILSSGLYANKVRAIIRELSCNAVDSHAAANKRNIPFAVHLPNSFEPWFSIRDYGTGLSHDQVTRIYTTYFESTKTGSNDFIGALGLGSKSPFSYTDNFTVTAIQAGRRGIYSAFINGDGVPSIALMMQEDTDEADGVEVKFSVNDRSDFYKFEQEAQRVYTHFALRPVITGVNNFKFVNVNYETRDIVPGVHSLKDSRGSNAVMGNIAYPIDVPQADTTLGSLRNLLHCGLEIHFGIGDLDFQASREGLSYIPQTVESIKVKLMALNAQLAIHVAAEADKIENLWNRAMFLQSKGQQGLWKAAVEKYITDTKFPLTAAGGYFSAKVFELPEEELATQYNLVIRAFQKDRSYSVLTNLSPRKEYNYSQPSKSPFQEVWHIQVQDGVHFVINDTKIGASQRAKYHWKTADIKDHRSVVYVLDLVDRTKPGELDEFFKAIHNPPNKIKASELLVKPREERAKNVTILRMEKKAVAWNRRDENEQVWVDAGKADAFDDNKTHYYLPLSGYALISDRCADAKELCSVLKGSGIAAFSKITVHGVRKGDIEFIKSQENWINLEDHIIEELAKLDHSQMNMKWIDMEEGLRYNVDVAEHVSNAASPYLMLTKKFMDVVQIGAHERENMNTLFKMFAIEGQGLKITTLQTDLNKEGREVYGRYPLLKMLAGHYGNGRAVAEYINLVDSAKGV